MTTDLNPARGWVARLAEDNPHRDRWSDLLKAGFDPWLEDVPAGDATVWALRSARFQDADEGDYERARGIAAPLIEQLNGAQALLGGLAPLRLAGLGYVDGRGGFSAAVFLELHQQLAPAVGVLTAELRSADGTLVPPSPSQPSEMQRWLEIASLLRWSSRLDNWFDIYKAIEAAELLGGGEHKFRAELAKKGVPIKRVRKTANSFRHTPGSKNYNKPKRPATLDDARAVVSAAVRLILDARLP
jgi:hypothetical protein